MSTAFFASYGALWFLVVLASAILRNVVRESAGFRRRLMAMTPAELPSRSRAPAFTAALASGTGHIGTSDLFGHEAMLLFVSTMDTSLPDYRHLDGVIHALWHRTEKRVYLVCDGTREECARLGRQYGRLCHDDELPVLLDERSAIARAFVIKGTPEAIMLNANGEVERVGFPEIDSSDDAAVHGRETPALYAGAGAE